MKHILCFGDSLTWGYNPKAGTRYPFEERYTGVLQQNLGNKYKVIEEGLNGRTTIYDDPSWKYRNGQDLLPAILETHAPLDLVILLLGTNDMHSYIHGLAQKAALGCVSLMRDIQVSQAGIEAKPPQILLLSPPHIIKPKNLMRLTFEGAESESAKLAKYYEEAAKAFGVHFLDTSKFIKPSTVDGIHLDVKSNKKLGEEVAKMVKKIV